LGFRKNLKPKPPNLYVEHDGVGAGLEQQRLQLRPSHTVRAASGAVRLMAVEETLSQHAPVNRQTRLVVVKEVAALAVLVVAPDHVMTQVTSRPLKYA
jgi:hypothetical protein